MRKSCLFSQIGLFDYVYRQLSWIFVAWIKFTTVLIVSKLIRDRLFWLFQVAACVFLTACSLFVSLHLGTTSHSKLALQFLLALEPSISSRSWHFHWRPEARCFPGVLRAAFCCQSQTPLLINEAEYWCHESNRTNGSDCGGLPFTAARSWVPSALERGFIKQSKGMSGQMRRKPSMPGCRFHRRMDKS